MEGVFVNTVTDFEQGATSIGYCIEEGGLDGRVRQHQKPGKGAGRGGNPYEELVDQDEAYRVEVFRYPDGVHHVRLSSDSRRAAAAVEGRLDTVERGRETTLAIGTGEPELPDSYEDPHRAIEMYARYALGHGAGAGVSGEFDWDELLEEGTR